ncbi:unnamed protein product [Albugo candida]|uniref:Uncharacterized protein n=1 Tax=Albugo candida TaxID=65357 RepID=A0A024FUY1_9STRA|nr:unnamed protein product [Albugo candida]|eukprot:CCI10953.1 unnamed protein product [Albugo candida]
MSWDLRLTGAACFLISRSANWFSFSKEYTSTLTWLIAIYSPSWNVNKKGACHFRSYRLERMLDRAHGSTLNIVALLMPLFELLPNNSIDSLLSANSTTNQRNPS